MGFFHLSDFHFSSPFPPPSSSATYTKLFVATGASASSFSDPTPELLADVEIVDLVELDHPCTKPRDFPEPMTGAVGAFVDGAPVICGGYYEDGSDRCYRVSKSCFFSQTCTEY